jgi:8-oxo-dGTP diphosphatase
MSSEPPPQFGTAIVGRTYVERPGAYAVIAADDQVLVVETPMGFFLPGGGIADGETAEQALRREVFEETGCRIASVREVGRARQYVGSGFNKVETFFAVELAGEVGGGSEADHRPRWVSAEDALVGLVEEAQRWAVRRALHVTVGGHS